MIRFGAWSTLLAVLALQMVLLAVVAGLAPANRRANHFLAALLLVMASMMLPFVLGYAGFYDAYPWLTAAPFSIPLALGPLAYLYVRALVGRRREPLFHFALPAGQFLYQCVLFTFPTASKWWWDENIHEPLIAPPLTAALLLSMAAYTTGSWRELRRYETWLKDRRRSTAPARRLGAGLVVLAGLLVAEAGYELFETWVRPIDYFDLFGFYVLIGILGIFLGLNGWRNSDVPAPAIIDVPERDWSAQGACWLQELRASDWWRDPSLDLPGLASRLGTNANHLSRALNAHAGGFAAALATLRAEAVAKDIGSGREADLLTLALEAGFGSKASFNRAFRVRYGKSPSAYRSSR
ncbi:MAG TPA: helix-turn-helix domain-containing protein [Allosphingosinicella sp.]|jgi:AraC-like DNA-binding protein